MTKIIKNESFHEEVDEKLDIYSFKNQKSLSLEHFHIENWAFFQKKLKDSFIFLEIGGKT